MFNTPTVFILGAGASWRYGYPTGEGLVRKAIRKAEQIAQHMEFAAREPPSQSDADRLFPKAEPRFLKQNPDLHEMGKLAIAMVIFDCERRFDRLGGNPNHHKLHNDLVRLRLMSGGLPNVVVFNDDWLRLVLKNV